jgi:hypothetical protein
MRRIEAFDNCRVIQKHKIGTVPNIKTDGNATEERALVLVVKELRRGAENDSMILAV